MKSKVATILVIGLVVLIFSSSSFAYTTMGNVKSYKAAKHDYTFTCENGKVKISYLKPDLVRVHMTPGSDFPEDDLHLDENGPYAVVKYEWPGVYAVVTDDGDYYKIYEADDQGEIVIHVQKSPFKLSFYDSKGNLLTKEATGLGHSGEKVYETMASPEGENFIGFGAYKNPLNMRGHSMTCYATELGETNKGGGFPVPWFMSSRGYAIYFNNCSDDVNLKMCTEGNVYSFEGTSGNREGWDMDYYFFYGPKFDKMLERYIELTGNPYLSEKWFFGSIMCHCCIWTAQDITDFTQRLRNENWPCDAVDIDVQWRGEDLNWKESFGDYELMLEKVLPLNFKLSIHENIREHTACGGEICVDMTDKNYYECYRDMRMMLQDEGFVFWRHDNGEYCRGMFANGYPQHQLFGTLWAKTVIEAMNKRGNYGPVVARSGSLGAHRYIAPWPGDVLEGTSKLRTDLDFIRNGGLAAFPTCGPDMGGFYGSVDDKDVMRRLIPMYMVFPIARSHGHTSTVPKLPWNFSEKAQPLYRFYLTLRYRLHPYIYSAAIKAHETGRPILAPLVFDYQNDPETYSKDYHFMFGEQILVAPVLKETETWDVYLPEGEWIHYWTGKKYNGKQTIQIDAPTYGKDNLPMFVKEGAILPMMPAMNYIYEKAPDPITLDVYPKKNTLAKHILYDRISPPEPTTKTVFTVIDSSEKIAITTTTAKVSYELCVHSAEKPKKVTVNSEEFPMLAGKAEYGSAPKGWYYGPGSFYGSDTIATVNIKGIKKSSSGNTIELSKR